MIAPAPLLPPCPRRAAVALCPARQETAKRVGERAPARAAETEGMQEESLRFHVWFTVGLIVVGLVAGLAQYAASPLTFSSIRSAGRLVVLTRDGATTWYENRDGEPEGFEYELARAFARHLGVEAEFVVMGSGDELFEALEAGRGHIAAAGLTPGMARSSRLAVSPPYLKVRQQLVCNRHRRPPRKREHLPGRSILVAANSPYEARLRELAADLPGLAWTPVEGADTEELFERVAGGEADCTVAHSSIVLVSRRYHPELVVPFDLTDGQDLVWVFPAGEGRLRRALESWFRRRETRELVVELVERFYAQVEAFDYVDLARFRRRIESRLPQYRRKFETVAEWHGLPWTLLAAVAYQESHWDPGAKSMTGVRGLMMLTLQTAEYLGIKNREDPAQSIAGGAKYLAGLLARVPESVTGRDRLWFALAAYNVGMGHMYDARRLARKFGRDPDKWTDLAKILPLLAREKYYTMKEVRHGRARGHEPVRYVKRVRHYMAILDREFGLHGHKVAQRR